MAKKKYKMASDLLRVLVFGFGAVAIVCFMIDPKNAFWIIVLAIYSIGLPFFWSRLVDSDSDSGQRPLDIPRGPGDFMSYDDADDGDSY